MAHVLLIDDDVDFIDMNKAVLQQRKHQVSAAYSANEAKQILQQIRPDIAVVDVMMETKSAGFDLARALHEGFPGMPVIMLTGMRKEMGLRYKFEPDETWLPVSCFLEKPFPPAALADKVEAMLAKAADAAGSQPQKPTGKS